MAKIHKSAMCVAAVAGCMTAQPTMAFAAPTTAQLTAVCKPQLDEFLRLAIAEGEHPESYVTDGEDANARATRIRETAELRAQGASHPIVARLISEARDYAIKSPGKVKGDIAEMHRMIAENPGPMNTDTAVSLFAACVAEATVSNKAPPAVAANTAVPPLRPTIVPEAHNPASEATACLEGIFSEDFKKRGVSSLMQAVIRNSCPRPVTVTWCIDGWDCKPGYSNLGKVPAKADMPVSFVYKQRTATHFAGCYTEFTAQQGELSKKQLHACK